MQSVFAGRVWSADRSLENRFAGRIWPAGRSFETPDIEE